MQPDQKQTSTGYGYIDVVGEADTSFGHVKISYHMKAPTPAECPDWQSGDFDGLELLHHRTISLGDIHWNAWVIFRSLQQYHVADDWFDVRHLVADSDWESFLTAAIEGTVVDRPVVAAAPSVAKCTCQSSDRPAERRPSMRQWLRARLHSNKEVTTPDVIAPVAATITPSTMPSNDVPTADARRDAA